MEVTTPEKSFFDWARNATGGESLAVDGSSVPVAFDLHVPTGPLYIERCNFVLLDSKMLETTFGGLDELENGLLVQAVDATGTVLVDYMHGRTIRKNADFDYLAGVDRVPHSDTPGGGADSTSIRWTLSKGTGGPLYLATGRRLRFTVQDALEDLAEFRIMGQGRTG
jgi:hypothetical protein